eukprot:GFKZ01002874.1.p1 GENE.GFKZ01002874.1~~GFKZ01002874.1.p1  ORF type:complete len:199 (-),score=29.78 GFKZ01002874.1:1428-2024(-)
MFQKTIIIDGKGHLLGRLASVIARELLNGQKIVVVRCEDIDISGTRHRNRKNFQNYLRKRTNTNPKWGPFHHRAPRMILLKAVRGMLPRKTKRGEEAMSRFKAFEGIPPIYAKTKRMVVPDALRITHLRPSSKFTNIGRMAGEMGWKYGQLIRKMEEQRKVESAAQYEKKKALVKMTQEAVDSVDLTAEKAILEPAGY